MGTVSTIENVTISSGSTADNYGDLRAATRMCSGCADATIGLIGGGETTNNVKTNVIDKITIASGGTSTSFGTLSVNKQETSSFANNTKAIFCGGSTGSVQARMDRYSIATGGSAEDFGDLVDARRSAAGLAA